MYFRTEIAFLVLVAAVPTLSFTVHDPTSDKLEGRQQVSLSKGISANDRLAESDSPLLVLAITTEDLRNDNKAVQNAEKKGNLFGCPIKGKWTLFYAEYDPQIYITSQADHILELQLITHAMKRANVASVGAFEESQWKKIIDLANAVENMAYIETYLNHHKAAVVRLAMKYIYDEGTQHRTYDLETIYSPMTKVVNKELNIYLHSSCQAMLNTATQIDNVALAATSQQNQFNHKLNLHNDVANLLRFMKIPVQSAGAGGLWKCDPPPMMSLFKEQD